MKLHNISFGNIKRRKAKMLFLVTGLVLGISTVVTLLSITESMSRDIEARLNQFGANIVVVPKTKNLSLNYGGVDVGGVSYEVTEFDQEQIKDVWTIKNNKNLSIVAPKVLGPAVVDENKVLLMGVDFEHEINLKRWWQTTTGRFPEKENDVMLGSRAAALLGYAAGETIELSGKPFHVATVLQSTGGSEDNAVIGHLASVQKLLGKEGKISQRQGHGHETGGHVQDAIH